MGWVKNTIVLSSANILIFICFLGGAAITPPLMHDIRYYIRNNFSGDLKEADVDRVNLPVCSEHVWAKKRFIELKNTETEYYDYVGWRRNSFNGETITVDGDGHRRHDTSTAFIDADVWFFGGSTMWGLGVNDASTIPAHYQARTGSPSFNFGELGYTAHQSLNLLMKTYVRGGRPKRVVFYDGVNDVLYKCRSEMNFFSSQAEWRIRDKIQRNEAVFRKTDDALAPAVDIFLELYYRFSPFKPRRLAYDCDINSQKVRHITQALLLDWRTAKAIVEQYGGEFYAVLQPLAFAGSPNLSYLPKGFLMENLRRQYGVVYREIKKTLRREQFDFLDLTRELDNGQYYIDFCHVIPEGNRVIANAVARVTDD
ncbi:MAG: hypothetical protein ACR2PG_03335 [Hyphomicrobiaceae bacterium]